MEPKCQFCGSANIFVGFFSIECPNETCKNFSIKQKEILIEKNKDLESNIVHITSQNHGYVVQELPDDMEVSLPRYSSFSLKLKSSKYF